MLEVCPVLALVGQPTAAELAVRVAVGDLLEALEEVPDPRDRRGVRYSLPLVIGLAVFAVAADASTFVEIAETAADLAPGILAGFGCVRRPPSAATFRRVLCATDPDRLDAVLCRFTTGLGQTPPEPEPEPEPEPRPEPESLAAGVVTAAVPAGPVRRVVSLDGKTLKGARRFDEDQKMTQDQIVAAFEHDRAMVLGQLGVTGGDENAAAKNLVSRLGPDVLCSAVTTADAKHTGAAFANAVTAAGGYWLLPVKGNQPTIKARLDAVPWPEVPCGDLDRHYGHGRTETRTIKVVALAEDDDAGLPGARQAILVHRWRRAKKSPTAPAAVTRETVYYLTSLPPEVAGPPELAGMVRDHWGVEVIHHIRDTTFDEDRHTARTGHGPTNFACLRNTVVNLHRHHGTHEIRPSLRASARKPDRVLDLLKPQGQL